MVLTAVKVHHGAQFELTMLWKFCRQSLADSSSHRTCTVPFAIISITDINFPRSIAQAPLVHRFHIAGVILGGSRLLEDRNRDGLIKLALACKVYIDAEVGD